VEFGLLVFGLAGKEQRWYPQSQQPGSLHGRLDQGHAQVRKAPQCDLPPKVQDEHPCLYLHREIVAKQENMQYPKIGLE
jgi:hypothetical protein